MVAMVSEEPDRRGRVRRRALVGLVTLVAIVVAVLALAWWRTLPLSPRRVESWCDRLTALQPEFTNDDILRLKKPRPPPRPFDVNRYLRVLRRLRMAIAPGSAGVDFTPRVQMGQGKVEVGLVTFSPFGGIRRHDVVISRAFPHRIQRHGVKTLVAYHPGFVY